MRRLRRLLIPRPLRSCQILKPQLRLITLGGERLTLSTVGSRDAGGASETSRLEWQKIRGKGDHI